MIEGFDQSIGTNLDAYQFLEMLSSDKHRRPTGNTAMIFYRINAIDSKNNGFAEADMR